MPVYLRHFYYNTLLKTKTEEQKKIDEASKKKSRVPNKPKLPKLNK